MNLTANFQRGELRYGASISEFTKVGVAALFGKIVTVTEQRVVFQKVLHRPIA
jgi:hypothetical protein